MAEKSEVEIFKKSCEDKLLGVIRNLQTRLQTESNIINRYEIQIVIKSIQDVYDLLLRDSK